MHVAVFVAVSFELCSARSQVLPDIDRDLVAVVGDFLGLNVDVVLDTKVAKGGLGSVDASKVDLASPILCLCLQVSDTAMAGARACAAQEGLTPSNVEVITISTLFATAGVGVGGGSAIASHVYPVVSALQGKE